MKSINLTRIVTIFLLILHVSSCQEEEIDLRNDNANDIFQNAKNYFEQNIATLNHPQIGCFTQNKSRNINVSSGIITSDWENAIISENEYFSNVEIPLKGDVFVDGNYAIKRNQKYHPLIKPDVATKLIIQYSKRHHEYRAFVVTLIGKYHREYGPNISFVNNNIVYGIQIISDVDGKYLDAYNVNNSQKQRVILARAAGYETIDSTDIVGKLYLCNTPQNNIFFRSGETNPPIDMGCPLCGDPNCDGSCEVVVRYCQRCHRPVDECACCPVCGDYPCSCSPIWFCPKCGSQFCSGNCDQTPGGGGETDPEECHHKPCPGCGKMIRTLTSASICDSHEYCENDGKCIHVQVNVSQNEATLGDSYTVTVTLTPQDADYFQIAYYIVEDGKDFLLPQPDGTSKTLVNMARTPGNFQIKAVVLQNETYKEYSGTTNVTHVFPSRDEILKQTLVIEKIDEMWNNTLLAAKGSTCQEFGGVVVINTKETNSGDLYRFESREGQPTPYSAPAVSVDLQNKDISYGPDKGGEFTVLIFHTHPPYWNYEGKDLYLRKVGPSDPDINDHKTIPAVVKDFQHPTGFINTRMKKSEYEGSEKLYYYGIDRRTN